MAETSPGGLPPPRLLIDEPWLREFIGARLIAGYMRLGFATSKIVCDPPDMMARNAALEPAIFVSWHATILTSPVMVPNPRNLVSLATPHPDGQMGGAASRAFGVETITATGRSERQTEGTGGVAGFRTMIRKLAAGKSVYITGEIPPTPGRQVSRGVIALARISGRPIVPLGAASSRQTIFERLWDKMQLIHPYGRLVVTSAEPLLVSADTTDEEAVAILKQRLDEAYARALRLAGG